ncbi:MAG TPA: LacI family transcriptional regulator [Pseudomonadaceae bacterium]|nr:LacI family transcriptional regulator [Pseudomonadaceae bacterium]
MTKHHQPSAHDVARLAGVSQAAVSRAFTPGASISQKTREKVLSAAETLGYRPNLLARSLITGRSGIIGVVVGSTQDAVVAATLDELLARLSEADRHILVFTTREADHADKQVEDLLKYRVDALLLMTANLSPTLAERCREEGIPVIFFNRQFGRSRGFITIEGNNRKGAEAIADHLVEQGYKKIGMMTGHEQSSTSHQREVAFTNHLAKKGIELVATESGHCHRVNAIEAARRLLDRKGRPDAVFCANDHMALAMIEVARWEFGLEIGRELGVAGFDDIEQSSWPSFDLTTYSYPVEDMIGQVCKLLLADPPATKPFRKAFNGELRVRGSTRRS